MVSILVIASMCRVVKGNTGRSSSTISTFVDFASEKGEIAVSPTAEQAIITV
jgi:hypothetical protein